jgi:hypothetical protein
VPDSLLSILKLAFLALLWLFFLRVVRAVWAELKEPAPAPVPAPAAAPAVRGATSTQAPAPPTRVTSGRAAQVALKVVEPKESAGRVYPLGEEVTVGRAAGCGVALVEDRMVSQLHARIFRGGDGQLFVEDLGSTNGTLLNRTKVAGPVAMKRGDRLQVGRTLLEVVPAAGRPG